MVRLRADVEVHRQLQVGARLPQRVPRAVGEVGRALVLRVGRDVHAAHAHGRARAALRARTRRRPTPGGPPSGAAGCPTPPASRRWSRCRSRCRGGAARRRATALAQALAAEADGVREDDLRVDAGLVHHREARARGRTRAGWILVDLPLVERLERPALVVVLVDDAAGAGPAEHRRPRRPTSPAPSTCSTWGMRSFSAAGARLVQRSWRSVRWVSASTTLTCSSGSPCASPVLSVRGSVVRGKPRFDAAVARVEPAAGDHLAPA